MAKSWDAIVIGSGMGGMACAAALAKYQQKVLVLEQHYVPGGYTHTFSRKGFVWDVGVHCLGEMGPREIPGQLVRWLSDGEIKMNSMGPIYETFHFPESFKITFPDSSRKFKADLEERFPDEKDAIGKYFDLIKQVSKSAKLYFALRAMPEWVDRIASKSFCSSAKKYWEKTTAEVLDTLTANEKLKMVLTAQWGYYGSTPRNSSFGIHAITARHFWNGGYYPVHGSHVFAESFLKVVSNAGGEVRLRTPVEEVIIRRGKAVGVRTSQGEEIFGSKVISAAGAKTTVGQFLPEEFRATPWGQEILSMEQSPSYICLNLGFEGDILAAGASVSNQWFFESWSSEVSEWNIEDPNSTCPILYVSFPSLKDPTHDAGEKKRHTGEVVTFVPWKAFEKWKHTRRGKREPDYLQFKKSIEDRLLNQMKKHMPKLMELVVHHELSTPLSSLFFTRAQQGAIYGLEATPRRFTSMSLRTRTPVKNLYLAGGDVATLGVTGALVGGVLAAGTVQPKVFSKLIFRPSHRRRESLSFLFGEG